MGKKNFIILFLLAIVGFAGPLIFGYLNKQKQAEQIKQNQPDVEEATAVSTVPTLAGTPVSIAPTKKELDELIRRVKEKESKMVEQQRLLDRREQQIKIAENQIIKKLKDLENLRVEIESPLKRLRDRINELENRIIVVTKAEDARLKKIALTFQNMDPTRCAQAFVSMAGNGQTEYVVKLLTYMEARRSAKILNDLTEMDSSSAASLVNVWKTVRQE